MLDEFHTFLIAIISTVVFIIIPFIIFYSKAPVPPPDVSKGLKQEEKNSSTVSSAESSEKVLNPSTFRKFKLLNVTTVNHNTKILRFEIPNEKSIELPIGRHISVRADIDGMKVMRAYTPTSRPDKKGFFDLLVKSYEFGKMSTYLHGLKIGDELEVRGPIGRFQYHPNKYSRIGLLAGGTGITPCLQLIRCVLESPMNSNDTTCFTLFFQNRTMADILLRRELDELQTTYPKRLHILYFLSNSAGNKEWGLQENEKRGYINSEYIYTYMKPTNCEFIGICGPSSFNDAMKNLAVEAGHSTSSSIYVW